MRLRLPVKREIDVFTGVRSPAEDSSPAQSLIAAVRREIGISNSGALF